MQRWYELYITSGFRDAWLWAISFVNNNFLNYHLPILRCLYQGKILKTRLVTPISPRTCACTKRAVYSLCFRHSVKQTEPWHGVQCFRGHQLDDDLVPSLRSMLHLLGGCAARYWYLPAEVSFWDEPLVYTRMDSPSKALQVRLFPDSPTTTRFLLSVFH